jgi:uncharacterized RDD family membrane protein YckC
MRREVRAERIRALQGIRAGFVSRILAAALDVVILFVIGGSVVAFVALVRWVTTSHGFHLERPNGVIAAVAAFLIAVVYFGYFWSATGRTPAEQVFGLRTLLQDGGRMDGRLSYARAVLTVIFPAGLLWVLVSSKNASVQDLLCRTAVVYDWSYHPPES